MLTIKPEESLSFLCDFEKDQCLYHIYIYHHFISWTITKVFIDSESLNVIIIFSYFHYIKTWHDDCYSVCLSSVVYFLYNNILRQKRDNKKNDALIIVFLLLHILNVCMIVLYGLSITDLIIWYLQEITIRYECTGSPLIDFLAVNVNRKYDLMKSTNISFSEQ